MTVQVIARLQFHPLSPADLSAGFLPKCDTRSADRGETAYMGFLGNLAASTKELRCCSSWPWNGRSRSSPRPAKPRKFRPCARGYSSQLRTRSAHCRRGTTLGNAWPLLYRSDASFPPILTLRVGAPAKSKPASLLRSPRSGTTPTIEEGRSSKPFELVCYPWSNVLMWRQLFGLPKNPHVCACGLLANNISPVP